MASEVGVAYVRLLPSMQGFSAAAASGLTSGLVGPSTQAGRSSGQGFVTGLGSALQSGGARISGIGDSLTRGLTLPLVGLGAVAFNASNKFNEGMANVATLIPGNTARVEELSTGVRGLAVDMGTTTGDMTDGLYQVISAFGDSSQSMSLLEINAKAAKAGMAETTDAINLTSAVTKGYGDTSAEAVQKASDLALLTVRMGQTTFPELAGAIGQVIPIAQNLGVTQEELFGSMATFTGVTGTASEVATQMRAAMQGLQAPTADAADAIKEAGFSSGAAAVEELGLAGAVGILTDAADESGQPLQKFLGQVEGQTFALGLAGAQAGDYETKLAEMGNAAGVTDEAFKEATQGVNAAGFQWDQAKAKANDLMIELGDALAPAITSLVDSAGPLITGLSALATSFSNASPATQKWITTLLGVAVALGPVMSILGRVTSAVGGAIRGIASFGRGTLAVARFSGRMAAGLGRGIAAFGRLAVAAGRAAVQVIAAGARMAAQAAAAAARVVAQIVLQIARWVVLAATALASAAAVALAWLISMGPIILVGLAIAALVALVIIHFDTIKRAIMAAFNWVRDNWPLLLAILTGPIGLAVLAIIKHWDKIKAATRAAFNAVKSVITSAVNGIRSRISSAWSFIQARTRSAFNAVKSLMTTPVRAAKSTINTLVEGIKGFFRGIKSAVRVAFSGLASVIKSPFTSAFNAIKSLWNSTAGGFGFTIPSWVPGVGGNSFTIPSMHTGGVVPGTGDVPILAKGGEGVFTSEQMAALAPVSALAPVPRDDRLVIDVTGGTDDLVRLVQKWVGTKGRGNVQSLAGAR